MGHEHFKPHVNKALEQISPPVYVCLLVKHIAAPTVSCNPVHAYCDFIFELMNRRPTLSFVDTLWCWLPFLVR